MTPKRVLIVEDEPNLRDTLLSILASQGYQAEAAGSLRQSLQLVEQFAPDLIVSDVHLEEGDGRELLRSLQADDRLQGCQFVFMTGDVQGASQRSGMNLGADDYLAKPFSVEEFLDCVAARFNKRDGGRDAERQLMTMMRESVSLTVPHEFLTPLNGIIGLSDFLAEADEDTSLAAVRELAADINECGNRLLRTVRNYLAILDVMEHPAAVTGPTEAVAGAAVNAAAIKVARGVSSKHKRCRDVRVDRLLSEEASARLNLERFEALLQELLDNALKFSRQGTAVRIALALTDEALLVSVEDFGCGMTRDQLRSIGAFQQFDRKRYAQQGLGLGLTLAQQLLARDGGGLRMESEVGRGTLAVAHWAQNSGQN